MLKVELTDTYQELRNCNIDPPKKNKLTGIFCQVKKRERERKKLISNKFQVNTNA